MADILLAAKGLGKTYGTAAPTRALDDVSFELERGEFASIVGQSGSGKSTLLNLLGLLDTPTDGEVVYNNERAGTLPKKDRARLRNSLIGFVFQFHYLLPEFSVFENVTMPSLISGGAVDATLKARAEETLGMLGLSGLEGKGAEQLSGGQKQRVAIARALMNRPALVLADEPTGNLDTANTDQVHELFRRISAESGTAFLIVTHDRLLAQRTDRILEVTDGRLVQDVRSPVAVRGADAVPEGVPSPPR